MPFAEVGCRIPVLLQHLGQRYFAIEQVHWLITKHQHIVDARAEVMASGQQCGARRRADRSPGIKIGEAHATGSETVQSRRLHRAAIAPDVFVAQIIDIQHDNVWAFGGACCRGGQHDSHQNGEDPQPCENPRVEIYSVVHFGPPVNGRCVSVYTE